MGDGKMASGPGHKSNILREMLPATPKCFAIWTPFSGLALLRPSQASPSDGSILHRSSAKEVLRRCTTQRDQLSTELISQSFALTVEVCPPAPGVEDFPGSAGIGKTSS